MHTTTADKDELNDLIDIGWERAGKAFYSVGFDNIWSLRISIKTRF